MTAHEEILKRGWKETVMDAMRGDQGARDQIRRLGDEQSMILEDEFAHRHWIVVLQEGGLIHDVLDSGILEHITWIELDLDEIKDATDDTVYWDKIAELRELPPGSQRRGLRLEMMRAMGRGA